MLDSGRPLRALEQGGLLDEDDRHGSDEMLLLASDLREGVGLSARRRSGQEHGECGHDAD
jgi:hypothetical protein